jgi:hypothetical protein
LNDSWHEPVSQPSQSYIVAATADGILLRGPRCNHCPDRKTSGPVRTAGIASNCSSRGIRLLRYWLPV